MPLWRALGADVSGWFGPEATAVLLFWSSFAPSFAVGLVAIAFGRPRTRKRVASLLWRWLPASIAVGAFIVMLTLVMFRLGRGLPLTPYLHYQAGGGFFSPRHAVPAHVQALLLVAGAWFGTASALSVFSGLRRSGGPSRSRWRFVRRLALGWSLVAVAAFALILREGAPADKAAFFGVFSATFSLGLIGALGLSAYALFQERGPKFVPVATLLSAAAVAVLLLEATVNPLRLFW